MKEISVYPGFWTGILHFLHGMNRSIKGYPMHRKALAQQICVSRRDVDKLRGRAEIFGLLMGWHSALFISTFAEIDQLTAHSDIERQDDKSSNDTQSSTIVYGKEREE